MFSDLKNVYENVDVNQTKKKIEEWLFKLAELMQNDNNYDNSLDETNEHFLKVCGKVYEPVGYSFNYFNCCKGKITIYSGSENYMTYKVYYNGGDDKEIWLYTHPQEFYKFDERYVVDIWAQLKQLPVKEVHEKILEQQTKGNHMVENEIRTQLDRIQSAGRID